MWLTGQCGSTFGLWLAGPAEGCHRRRRGSPSSAGMGMVGGRAVWATRVVTFDVSGSGAVNRWGPRCGRALMLRAASSEWRVGAVLEHGRSRRGGGCRWKGGRDLRSRWRAVGGTHVGSGLVQTGQLAGISGCAGLLWVGWRAAEVVTELSQAARNMVGRRQMR